MLRIDRKSHRYLIEPLSEIPHLRRSLLLGFNSFVQKLQNSPKKAVRSVFDVIKDDCRSITGSNITLECRVNPHQPFSDIAIKKAVFFQSPDNAAWIISVLLEARDGKNEIVGWTKEEINNAIEYLCIS